jgi:hypothetical protein
MEQMDTPEPTNNPPRGWAVVTATVWIMALLLLLTRCA